MHTRTKIVLAAALIVTSAGAALASNENEDKGGFVVPGSTVGVNPAYHTTQFPDYTAQSGAEAYDLYVPAKKAPHRTAR
jgi:hypothetical protein